jgi:hypothetical protein
MNNGNYWIEELFTWSSEYGDGWSYLQASYLRRVVYDCILMMLRTIPLARSTTSNCPPTKCRRISRDQCTRSIKIRQIPRISSVGDDEATLFGSSQWYLHSFANSKDIAVSSEYVAVVCKKELAIYKIDKKKSKSLKHIYSFKFPTSNRIFMKKRCIYEIQSRLITSTDFVRFAAPSVLVLFVIEAEIYKSSSKLLSDPQLQVWDLNSHLPFKRK